MDNNIRFQKATTNEIRVASSELMKKGRMLFNNYYGVNDDDDCSIFFSDYTLLIRKKEFHFYRLYVMSLDETDLSMLLNGLSGEEYVLNIPSRKPIDDWDTLLKKCGFEFLESYSRFYNTTIKAKKYPPGTDTFAKESDVDDIANLLYNNFSLYTDHLPSVDTIRTMVKEQRVFADYDSTGKICGVLIFTITGNKCYQDAWIDLGENGLKLFFAVYNMMQERNIGYTNFWVRDTNKSVIKMHYLMGDKMDGMKDYTYLKK